MQPLEQSLPDFFPGNGRLASRIDVGDPAFDLGRPQRINVWIGWSLERLDQESGQGGAILLWQAGRLIEKLLEGARHDSILRLCLAGLAIRNPTDRFNQ